MTEPQPPRWVVWVARVVAVVVVVPVTFVWAWVKTLVLRPVAAALRWVWRSGAVVARFLWRSVLVPLGRGVEWVARLVHRRVLRPVGWVLFQVCRVVGIGLWWVARQVGRFLMWIDAPLTAGVRWLFRWIGKIITFVARGLWDAVVWVVVPLWRWLVVVPVRFVYRWLLTPIGHALQWVFVWAVKIIEVAARVLRDAVVWAVVRVALPLWRLLVVLPLRLVYRWLLTPIGHALRWVFRWTRKIIAGGVRALRVAVVWAVTRVASPLWRWLVVLPARFVYREVLTPVGNAVRAGVRWVRRTLVEPVRQTVSTMTSWLRRQPAVEPSRDGQGSGTPAGQRVDG
ncbi:hypothetical protein GCM10010492_66350 [Saccharothrix mutabilis subsp. mutabilis]|uniref:Uncharacterized protein n=1 Tax=Saccharothrix mutabilis subsp. mutabilis TaxID=66855 RepID=A0ABN0UNB0_9PSEU